VSWSGCSKSLVVFLSVRIGGTVKLQTDDVYLVSFSAMKSGAMLLNLKKCFR
jgi:hypothetical protein